MTFFNEMQKHSYNPIICQPILISVGMLSKEFQWKAYTHIHDETSEVLYVEHGEGEVFIGGTHYPVKDGDLILINPAQEHYEDFHKSSQSPVLFHFELLSLHIHGLPVNYICPLNSPPVTSVKNLRNIFSQYYKAIFHECREQKFGYEQIVYTKLENLILMIVRLYADYFPIQTLTDTSESNLAIAIKTYIDCSYRQNIRLADIAETMSVNPYYISRVFSTYFGCSPINYLISRRLNEAKQMLVTSQVTVKEIAIRLGYKSTCTFVTQFKKHVGCSPTAYRGKWKDGEYLLNNMNDWTEYLH